MPTEARTALPPPSQPISQRACTASSAPSGRRSDSVTPASSWASAVASVDSSIVTLGSCATRARSTRSSAGCVNTIDGVCPCGYGGSTIVMRRISWPSTPKYSDGVNGSQCGATASTTPICWKMRMISWSSAIARGISCTPSMRSHTYTESPARPSSAAATTPAGP
jgi:hypothetical protein